MGVGGNGDLKGYGAIVCSSEIVGAVLVSLVSGNLFKNKSWISRFVKKEGKGLARG